MVAKIIHDGALRGPDLSDDELKQKIKATEGGTDFEESEMVSLYSFILSTLLKRLNFYIQQNIMDLDLLFNDNRGI